MNTFEGSYAAIPELTKSGITRYVEHHCTPGGFLSAVICGDLYKSVRRADLENRKAILLIALWFDEFFPHLTGPDNFKKHIENKEQP